MTDDLRRRVANALMSAAPVLEPDEAERLAEVAIDLISTPDTIGSGLNICKVCRAPRPPSKKARR